MKRVRNNYGYRNYVGTIHHSHQLAGKVDNNNNTGVNSHIMICLESNRKKLL